MVETLSQTTQDTLANLKFTGLVSRNIRIHERRTSIRLEPEMWDALHDIAASEECTIHDICSALDDIKQPSTSFTAALRVFLVMYYKVSAV